MGSVLQRYHQVKLSFVHEVDNCYLLSIVHIRAIVWRQIMMSDSKQSLHIA